MAAPTNAILLTNIGDETITAEVLGSYLLLLADRNALPNHPALFYAGDINGSGANAIKVPQVGMAGYDPLASATEADPIAATQITDGSATLTVAQFTKAYTPSDLSRIVDKQGFLNTANLALDAVISGSNYLRYMVANVTDDFTATAGTSGVAASASDAIDATTTLTIAKVNGPFLAVIHPKQWGDIIKDAGFASGGAIVYNPGIQSILDGMKGLGYQGNWLGVDWFTTTDVPTADAAVNRAGGIFGRGAVQWADATIPTEDPANQMSLAGKVLFERLRLQGGATRYETTRYLAAGIGINACGVTLKTKA